MSIGKISALLLVLGIISATFPAPAFAEGPTPPAEALQKALELVEEVRRLALLGVEPTPEIKALVDEFNLAFNFWTKWQNPQWTVRLARAIDQLIMTAGPWVVRMRATYAQCLLPPPGSSFIVFPGWRGIFGGGFEKPPSLEQYYCNQSGCYCRSR